MQQVVNYKAKLLDENLKLIKSLCVIICELDHLTDMIERAEISPTGYRENILINYNGIIILSLWGVFWNGIES